MKTVEERIADIVVGTGRVCAVGQKPNNGPEWFAVCDNVEAIGTSAHDALDKLTEALTKRAQGVNDDAIQDQTDADEDVRSSGVLLEHLRRHTDDSIQHRTV